MYTIEVFGKDNCTFCHQAKRALENANIPHTYTKIEDTETRQNVIDRTNGEAKTVPVIFVDNKWIGGWTELRDFMNSAEFMNTILSQFVVDIEFLKVDGTERKFTGTRKSDLIPQTETKKERNKSDNENYMPVYVPDIGEWRSFLNNKVTHYRINNQ